MIRFKIKRRCKAVLPPGTWNAGQYFGRCDKEEGHEGRHVLERGFDLIYWNTVVMSQDSV